MEADTTEKALRRIEKYLTQRGMKIIERGWVFGDDKIDFIADDNNELVFISCDIREGEGGDLGNSKVDRKMFERVSTGYLLKHLDLPETTVRMDAVSMIIVGDGKALLRLHVNALSNVDDLG